jgi:hypothetical protein
MKFAFLKIKMLKRKEGFKQSAVPHPLHHELQPLHHVLQPLHRELQRLLLEQRPIWPLQGHLL